MTASPAAVESPAPTSGSPTKSTMPKPVPIEVVAARHDDHAAIIVERTGSIIWPGVGAAPIIRSA